MHSLHAELRDRYTNPGDSQEVMIDGYIIDVVQPDRLIEIQTRNFGALKNKLSTLLTNHPVCLVYPLTYEKWIIHLDRRIKEGLQRRKSPRIGRWEDIFYELVHLPGNILTHPMLSLEILMIQVEEFRLSDGKGSWRRRGDSITDRKLLKILDRRNVTSIKDYLGFLPPELEDPFTLGQFIQQTNIAPKLAGRMIFTMRLLSLVALVGKQGRSNLYRCSYE